MKKIAFFTLFLCYFMTKFSFGQVKEDSVSLKTMTGVIHGTLVTPKGIDLPPIVLFIVGSGPTDRNGNNPMAKNNSLKLLAEALAEKGIASLRYDKRGIAGSQAALDSISHLRFEHWIEDAQSWTKWLSDRKAFSSITILGHSQGALVGLLAAQKGLAEKYISLAGAGEPIHKILGKQLTKNAPMLVDIAKPLLDSLAAGHFVQTAPPMLASIFDKSIQPFLISWMQYNPAKEIAKLKIPVLIIQGNTDIQVGLEDAKSLHDANNKNQLLIIDQMNHVLKKVSNDLAENYATYSNPNLPIHTDLIQGIVAFIKK